MTKNERNAARRMPTPAFIAALAGGATATDAGRAARVSDRTAQRWAVQEGVVTEVSALRTAMIERAAGRLAGLVDEAADTLRDVMRDESAAASARVRAASLILTLALELRDRTEIEARLAALESAQEAA